jgi:dUTP pyrophosphatase
MVMEDTSKIEIPISVSICRENVKLPFYANAGDAGMDIVSAAEVLIAPGETKLIPTGIKVAIPKGYEIQVRPRSGLSLNTPLRIPNSPGTIDSGFRDEIKVLMTNTSKCFETNDSSIEIYTLSSKGNQQGTYKISPGDRIAQIVLQRVPSIKWQVVESVDDIGDNRGGGFGSSGVK